MQDWAPRLIETWETEGQGIGGGGGQGSRSRGAESTRAARGHLRSRQQGRMRWMLVSSQHEAEEKGFKTGTGAETRQDRGRWDHRALGWELQPESWKRNKGQECWSMMGLGGGCHPVPPITTFTLRWPSRMELNHSPASVRSLQVCPCPGTCGATSLRLWHKAAPGRVEARALPFPGSTLAMLTQCHQHWE